MPRMVRVATVSMQGRHMGTMQENRDMVMCLLDEACRESPDIVCLPESYAATGIKGTVQELAEPVPGPSTEEAAHRAREHGTYVVCPVNRQDGDRTFASAVILDRSGQIAGIYDKLFLANTSWRSHREGQPYDFRASPGQEAKVFDLDLGRVGVQICFDMDFQDGWAAMANKGAELVFWPSAYGGGFHLRLQAFLHQYHVVSSVTTLHSPIVNPLGEVLEETGSFRGVVARTVNLEYTVCHFDWHGKKIDEIREKYGSDVTIRVREEEGVFLIESNREDLLLDDVVREFQLMSYREFHRRHREQLNALRGGEPV